MAIGMWSPDTFAVDLHDRRCDSKTVVGGGQLRKQRTGSTADEALLAATAQVAQHRVRLAAARLPRKTEDL